MTSAGSDGNTLDQFNKLLFCKQSEVHEEMKKLHQIFKRGKKQLTVAEAIFTSVKVLLDFQKLVSSNYEANVAMTKFPQPGENQVNKWCSDKTNKMIPEIVSNLDANTKMVLINAVYFKANWENKFDKKMTKKGYDFKGFEKPLKVDMMTRTNSSERFGNYKIGGVQFDACTLGYAGNSFSMLFMKPEKTGGKALSGLLKAMSSTEGFIDSVMMIQSKKKLERLMIPKCVVESTFGLKQILLELGFTDGFDDSKANFSKMRKENDLVIDQVIHKAKIIMDEVGTVAAAATAVVMRRKCKRPTQTKTLEFVLDRPYVCVLLHNASKKVIFFTSVVEPEFKK